MSVSTSDLITSLYSQAEQNIKHAQNPSESGFDSLQKVVNYNLVGDSSFDDDDFGNLKVPFPER